MLRPNLKSMTHCHRDACFSGYHVSRTHIPRDAYFPTHISLMELCLQITVIYVSPGILFPLLRCGVARAELCMTMM